MKNKFFNFRILSLIFTAFMISCSDNMNDNDNSEPVPNEERVALYEELATGAEPATEEEWKDIPILTDVKQLGWGNSITRNIPSPILPALKDFPLFDQLSMGTCTSSSIANSLSLVTRKYTGMEYFNTNLFPSIDSARTFSVSFLHHNAVGNPDKGVSIPKTMNALKSKGIPIYSLWKYNRPNITNEAPAEVKNSAMFNGTENSFFRIEANNSSTKEIIKNSILSGSPVVFSMYFPTVKNIPYLEGGQKILGKDELFATCINPDFITFEYHTMTIVGFDEAKQSFLVLNTWKINYLKPDGSIVKDWFGGANGAPKGCFWLKYDVVGKKYPYGDLPIITDFGTIGVKAHYNSAESSKIYEFTGYTNYKDIKYSDEVEISPGEFTFMRINKKGTIEYPMGTVIPKEGTIELDMYIDENGIYRELYDSAGKLISETNPTYASIFSSLIFMQSEKYAEPEQTEKSIGSMDLRVYPDGRLSVLIAEKDLEDALKEVVTNPLSSGINVLSFSSSHKLTFGKWHTIGLSFGSDGLKIKIDNNNADSFNCKIPLNNPQKNFQLGYTLSEHDKWINLYLPPETMYFPKGKSEKEWTGFTGFIKAFRTSDKQADWVITK